MIHVCIVAPRFMTGGQAIEAATLLTGFADDPEIRLEIQPIDPRIPNWLARIRGVRTVARMPLYLCGLFRRLRRADLVHIFTAAFSPFLLTTTPAILMARLLGKPVILNYRDGRAADHLASRWVRSVLRRAHLLVFPSGFLKDLFRRFGFDGAVVYNVVDMERFPFRPRNPLRPVLISCRLLERLYAVENTLRAFKRVRHVYESARLLVIGSGDQEEALRQIVLVEGIEGVEFHGAVPHADVARWMDRADIFVNSSREDNMPHSIIEAFSCGLPVITTGAGGIPYIVDHGRNGLLVDIDDPAALADAILHILQNPALAEAMIAEGLGDCKERYSWTAAHRRWSAIYHRMHRYSVAPHAAVGVGVQ